MDKFNLVKKFSRELTSTLEIKELAKVINRFAVVELGAESSSIVLAQGGRYSYDERDKIFDTIETETSKYVIKVGKCLRIAHSKDEYMLKNIEGIENFKLLIVSFPLTTKNQVLGALNLYFDRIFDDEFLDFLNLFTELSSSSIMNSLSYRNLEKRSLTDKLTGLNNRRDFDNEIEEKINQGSESKTPISIMMLDIDNFKEYNDQHGHNEGDIVLSEIGNAINTNLEEGKAFRYGGEEFSVVLVGKKPEDALEIAEKLRKGIEENCRITLSIGVATCLNSSCAVSTMIKEADKALYRAKSSGKNRVASSVIIDKAITPVEVDVASQVGKK